MVLFIMYDKQVVAQEYQNEKDHFTLITNVVHNSCLDGASQYCTCSATLYIFIIAHVDLVWHLRHVSMLFAITVNRVYTYTCINNYTSMKMFARGLYKKRSRTQFT